MGAIADAVIGVLYHGPCSVPHLGRRLAAEGITRARDPDRAVRRAVRDDRRVIDIGCGLLAMREQVLAGVTLTRRVAAAEAADGVITVDDDLAPIARADSPLVLRLPDGTPANALVALRVTDALGGSTALTRISVPPPRPGDERALVATVARGLASARGTRLPLIRLRDALLTATAFHPRAFRVPGRSLSAVLADAGLRVHLGWVGPHATDWDAMDAVEAALLEREVFDLMARDCLDRAIDRQARLVSLCDARIPDQAGAARQRLAALLDRAGRPLHALRVLTPLTRRGDPDAHYAMAVTYLGLGDEVSARRLVQEGVARATGPRQQQVRECLADLGSQLDGEAALARFASRTPGPEAWIHDPVAFARSVGAVGRAHLVEAVVEEVGFLMREHDLLRLLHMLAQARSPYCDDLLLVAAAVLDGPAALVAGVCARGRRATSPTARALATPLPVASWVTAPRDAPDQQQVIIAAARERGRIAPLIALIDHHDLGGALKDAFFLPDMVPARLWREVLAPMDDAGVPARPLGLGDAIGTVRTASAAAVAMGWHIPSEQQQPVIRRIGRLCGASQGVAGSGLHGGTAAVG